MKLGFWKSLVVRIALLTFFCNSDIYDIKDKLENTVNTIPIQNKVSMICFLIKLREKGILLPL